MDKQKEDYEKFFAEQSIHDTDLYKWGALWVFWQAAQSASQKDYALALEKIATMQVEIEKWRGKWELLKMKHDLICPIARDLEQQLSAANERIAKMEERIRVASQMENFNQRQNRSITQITKR